MDYCLTEPYPDRIIFDIGWWFAGGAFCGTAFHFPKGFYNAPRGACFIGGAQAVRMNAPRIAGRYAVWGGLYSTCECAVAYARKKEDPWNSILGSGAAGGLLVIRQGFGPMAREALGTAALFALLHGMFLTIDKFVAKPVPPVIFEDAPKKRDKAQQAAASSWFGGFRQKK